MTKVGNFIAKHKFLIVFISVLLLIPSVIGYLKTRINYDILSYLPKTLETVDGQDMMVDEYGMSAFSMVIVEGMSDKEAAALEEKIESIDHVTDVLWYDDFVDLSFPKEMIPDKLRNMLFKGDATMMIALFDNTTSADTTMNAITDMRNAVGSECFISGMSGVVTDIKNLAMSEMPVYVVIAALLSFVVLCLTTDSFVVPFLFLASIGFAILYNLGSNIFLGEISYITQALVAVLQLGVTMDYSIFLLSCYEENKPRFKTREEAMGKAIASTFTSVAGSSVTTVAGFAALMFMTFALGRDLGIVMIKGVIMGVICCITLLPSLILIFEKAIDKTTHKSFIPSLDGVSNFVTKHYRIWLVLFAIILFPAFKGNNNIELYYNIDSGLPDTLDSAVANQKLKDEFNMSNVHMVLLDNDVSTKDKKTIMNEIEDVDGVQWVLGLNTIVGNAIPSSFVPSDIASTFQSDKHEIMYVCSDYSSATAEVNKQIAAIQKIVKSYDETGMVIGEAPLMKDLEDVTSIDLQTVNTISIIAIFVIVMLVFKSISLPAILVIVIEFAIFVNMAISYYMGVSLPFVASIVIGTIQLGATVDYAILMTSRYKDERICGKSKIEAIAIAHKTSIKAIITSGLSFFAATIGVALYSHIDMIKAIVILLSRGAIISTVVVICILPSMFMVFDTVICKTTKNMKHCLDDHGDDDSENLKDVRVSEG